MRDSFLQHFSRNKLRSYGVIDEINLYCFGYTNVWIALLKNDTAVTAQVQRVGLDALYLCAPVWSELWFGACKSQRIAENQARIRALVCAELAV